MEEPIVLNHIALSLPPITRVNPNVDLDSKEVPIVLTNGTSVTVLIVNIIGEQVISLFEH